MLLLIAESKTMEKQEFEISSEYYESHRPVGEKEASEIMLNIKEMSVADIASTVKVSHDMALRLRTMAYEFPDKTHGMKAIEAFTGVVFKNLDYRSLNPPDKEWATKKIRIISSLYGWLKPEDIIKPYRLDYSSPLSPAETPLNSYWRSNVTIELVRTIQASGESQILDLLPADAAKSIDWKLVKRFAKVWKVDFKELNGEAVRSPHAGKLKALRGELLRNIILNRFETAGEIADFSNETMCPIPDYEVSGRLAFYV